MCGNKVKYGILLGKKKAQLQIRSVQKNTSNEYP